MTYWEAVLHEVMNKHNQSTQFVFTNLRQRKIETKKRKPRKMAASHENKMYTLGDRYSDIYFTQREAECMLLLLRGYTLANVAKELRLSIRTIEFYVKNMRMKVRCDTKAKLVEKVAQSDFLENMDRVM